MKFRIIPVTIFVLSIAVADRAFDLMGVSWVQNSEASTAATAAAKPEEKKPDDGKVAKPEEAKKPEKPPYTTEKPAENIPQFTTSEKEVLEKLSERRAELEKWQNELELKEKLIDASSQKLDEKIAELKNIQTDTAVLLKSYNEHEDAKIRSLVKIYEAMKPKDAANIFNEMDTDITLEIIDKMAEKKASPVIAAMDTKRARKITEELALQRSLKEAQGKRNLDVSAANDAPKSPTK